MILVQSKTSTTADVVETGSVPTTRAASSCDLTESDITGML